MIQIAYQKNPHLCNLTQTDKQFTCCGYSEVRNCFGLKNVATSHNCNKIKTLIDMTYRYDDMPYNK